MNLFTGTDKDLALSPLNDPDVIACKAALQAARREAEPAAKAWRDYSEAHADEPLSIPFGRQKQRLHDTFSDTAWAVEDAESALRVVLDAAIQRAKALWDARIREQFLDDVPAIEAFIELLATHEQTVIAAELAGVRHVLNVPHTFLTAAEVADRLAYAKRELGLT